MNFFANPEFAQKLIVPRNLRAMRLATDLVDQRVIDQWASPSAGSHTSQHKLTGRCVHHQSFILLCFWWWQWFDQGNFGRVNTSAVSVKHFSSVSVFPLCQVYPREVISCQDFLCAKFFLLDFRSFNFLPGISSFLVSSVVYVKFFRATMKRVRNIPRFSLTLHMRTIFYVQPYFWNLLLIYSFCLYLFMLISSM